MLPNGISKIIKDLLKFHRSPTRTQSLLDLFLKWKMKTFLPTFSIVTSSFSFHIKQMRKKKASLLTCFEDKTLPIKHCSRLFDLAIFAFQSNCMISYSSRERSPHILVISYFQHRPYWVLNTIALTTKESLIWSWKSKKMKSKTTPKGPN